MNTAIATAFALVSCLLVSETGSRDLQSCPAQKENAPKTVHIPLESIRATTGQKELTYIMAGFRREKDGSKRFDEPYGLALSELSDKQRCSSTNVLLAQAADITAAVKATHDVLLTGRSADSGGAGDTKATSPKAHWLAAYLGPGGSGTYRVVTSCTRKGNSMRLSYKEEQSGTGLIVVEQYFWAPLGDLEPGAYLLELFDTARDQLDVSRRVIVR